MPFAWVADALPLEAELPAGTEELPPLPSLRTVSFADSIELPETGGRARVRVAVSQRGSQLIFDFQDSDPVRRTPGFGADEADTRLACATALAVALGSPSADRRWLERCELQLGSHSWIGSGRPADPGRRAMSMARVYDAVLGALASAWPGRVGAGSTSLGALVELSLRDRNSADRVADVVAGGEGGQPHRPGRSGCNFPLLPANGTHPLPRWVDIVQRGRERSAGGGARPGGDGVERRYEVREPVIARVGIDRIANPPHGIDRAGPPSGSEVMLEVPNEPAAAVSPWCATEIPAGATLVVRTAGGAGHGFGGYGDIEFDASEWFGSKPDDDSH